MARLIDANKIVNDIALYMAENAYLNDTPLDALKMVANWITDAPVVDAVEVVRCKACKHWHQHNGKDSGKPVGYGDCKNPCGINGIAYEDSFCSYGERKDGD